MFPPFHSEGYFIERLTKNLKDGFFLGIPLQAFVRMTRRY
jgi:hypothetical protein